MLSDWKCVELLDMKDADEQRPYHEASEGWRTRWVIRLQAVTHQDLFHLDLQPVSEFPSAAGLG